MVWLGSRWNIRSKCWAFAFDGLFGPAVDVLMVTESAAESLDGKMHLSINSHVKHSLLLKENHSLLFLTILV